MEKYPDSFDGLYSIVSRLRSPEGCPWDRKQTLDSVTSALVEESYETITSIHEDDSPGICEEIGDVMLIVSMLMRIAEESEIFNPQDVFKGINEKLIRRHPHVFGEESISDADDVKKRWDEIKETVEGRKKKSGPHSVSPGFPPLERSFKIQKKAAKLGFDWPDTEGPYEKIKEEIIEIKDAVQNDPDSVEAEIGDLLFSVVNLSRKLKIDPATALHRSNEKFLKRFSFVEKEMEKTNKDMHRDNLTLMDEYWNLAKSKE